MTLASYITCTRILLIVPIIYLSSIDIYLYSIAAVILFVLAALTDYLDGYVARKTNTAGPLGATLDLVADKVFVMSLLCWLAFITQDKIVIFSCIVICTREVAITFFRIHLKNTFKPNLMVSTIGKLKTTLQMISIGMLLLSSYNGDLFYSVSISFLLGAALLTLVSFFDYIYKYLIQQN